MCCICKLYISCSTVYMKYHLAFVFTLFQFSVGVSGGGVGAYGHVRSVACFTAGKENWIVGARLEEPLNFFRCLWSAIGILWMNTRSESDKSTTVYRTIDQDKYCTAWKSYLHWNHHIWSNTSCREVSLLYRSNDIRILPSLSLVLVDTSYVL